MLADHDVIVIDCQTTGSTPERGHLLEVAWHRRGADVVSHLVRLPDGERIPRRIGKLTGISDGDLSGALSPAELFKRLRQDAAGVPAVAHFARFERAFLGPALDLDWTCTHEIVCRLMPGLPRRGLRAVAGYFGHVMDESKRAAAHVRATAAVWSAVAVRLRDAGVTTWAELDAWLLRVEPARRTGKDFPLARDKRLSLPDAPGVYRMLGKGGEVLYLGKATSLKRRVNSHFTSRGSDRSRELLTQAWDVAVEVTGSALEAAVKEADAIKEHAPPYNVALRGKDSVWFASRTLRSVRARPDARHRLGPLPDRDAVAAFAGDWERALGFHVEEEPLREGLALFRARHRARTPRELVRLGARLWFEPPEEPEQDPPPAERAAALIEEAVRRAAHLLRRARWLTRLSESTLEWSSHRLTVGRGRIGGTPDFARARLACFDPATYDRLRVLTTELKRLVAEERDLALQLGPRLVLDRERLARRLAWV
ncbi:MAG: GIY-YIG nuclease family protein [Planctomycetota bacterium]|jgi:DNA polymerase-3 subunit epsilon